LNRESLRTNYSAEAWISAGVAGGSKLNSVLMLRHIICLLLPFLGAPKGRPAHAKSYIAAHSVIE
jgi:hypothetical protein